MTGPLLITAGFIGLVLLHGWWREPTDVVTRAAVSAWDAVTRAADVVWNVATRITFSAWDAVGRLWAGVSR
jgi:hypothetical protein